MLATIVGFLIIVKYSTNMITIRRSLFTKTYAIHWSLPNGWNLERLYTFYATLM